MYGDGGGEGGGEEVSLRSGFTTSHTLVGSVLALAASTHSHL